MFYLLETPNLWRTKLYMIDIAKKLLIQFPEIKNIPEILHYFFRFSNIFFQRILQNHFKSLIFYMIGGVVPPFKRAAPARFFDFL